MIVCNLAKRSKFADARIRKNDVELAFLLLHCRVQPVQVRRFGHITLNARYVMPDLVHRCDQLALPAAHDEYERAFLNEPLCRCKSNSAAASGNHCNLLCEFVRHMYLP